MERIFDVFDQDLWEPSPMDQQDSGAAQRENVRASTMRRQDEASPTSEDVARRVKRRWEEFSKEEKEHFKRLAREEDEKAMLLRNFAVWKLRLHRVDEVFPTNGYDGTTAHLRPTPGPSQRARGHKRYLARQQLQGLGKAR